ESQTPIQSKIKKQNVDSEDPGNALGLTRHSLYGSMRLRGIASNYLSLGGRLAPASMAVKVRQTGR
ncbi:MAG: hypothetical protein QF512_20625, partial [Alphaproteobacteria bacterium]|nr:hypothetical protein [Alphaproteobacteria bacterium]